MVDKILPCNYAKEMQKKYPNILNKFSLEEIEDVWSSYSAQACAGWLYDDRNTIAIVFSQAETYFEYKKSNPELDDDNYAGNFFHWKNTYHIKKGDSIANSTSKSK